MDPSDRIAACDHMDHPWLRGMVDPALHPNIDPMAMHMNGENLLLHY